MEYSKEEKTEFARAWLLRGDPFTAALSIAVDVGRALQMQTLLIPDPFVLAEKERIKKDEGTDALPQKFDLASEAWQMATNNRLHPRDRLEAMELYGRVMGMIEKPGANVGNTRETPPTFIVTPED